MIDSERERRRDVRVTFRATALLKFAGGKVFDNCQTSDISVGGAFVEGVRGVAAGEQCTVAFHLIGRSSSLVLDMTGEVIRVMEQGVALQFAEVDEDSFCHLQNIVYFNYRQEGQLGESGPSSVAGIDDETLYLGLVGGKTSPLADNYLGSDRLDDFPDYGEDLDRDILDQVGPRKDEEDF